MSSSLLVGIGLCIIFASAVYWVSFRFLGNAHGWYYLGIVLFIVAMIYFCARTGYETWFYSDVPFHLALIREHVETGQWLFPGDPFFSGYVTPLHHSLLHIIGAMFVMITRSVEHVWTILGIVYLVMAVIAAVLLGRTIFYKAHYGYGFAVLFVLMLLTSSMIPDLSLFSSLLIFIGYVAVIRVVAKESLYVRDAVIIGLLCGLAIAIRLLPGLFGYAGIIFLIVWMSIRKRIEIPHISAMILIVLLPMVIASPWLANMIGQAAGVQTAECDYYVDIPSYLKLRAGYFLTMFRIFLFVWLKYIVMALYIGGGIIFFIDKRVLQKQSSIVLRWLVVFYIVLFFFPWEYFSTICGLDSYRTDRLVNVTGRMLILIPSSLFLFILVVKLRTMSDGVNRNTLFRIVQTTGLFAVLFLILSGPAIRTRMRFEIPCGVRSRFEYITEKKEDILRVLKKQVVLSDAWTSYMTKYELDFYCVTAPVGHSSAIVDVVERSRQSQRFFAGLMTEREADVFLRRYGINYVLVNLHLARHGETTDFSPIEYEDYNEDYVNGLKILELIYRDDEIILWRVKKEV